MKTIQKQLKEQLKAKITYNQEYERYYIEGIRKNMVYFSNTSLEKVINFANTNLINN